MMPKITDLMFGVFSIPLSQVFLLRQNFYAMVNLKPFVPGHVLLCTRKVVPRLELLKEEEVVELFLTAQQICQKLSYATNLNYQIVLQNGKQAGQTVEHLHLHIIPKHLTPGLERFTDAPRSPQDMAEEATKYRELFQQ